MSVVAVAMRPSTKLPRSQAPQHGLVGGRFGTSVKVSASAIRSSAMRAFGEVSALVDGRFGVAASCDYLTPRSVSAPRTPATRVVAGVGEHGRTPPS